MVIVSNAKKLDSFIPLLLHLLFFCERLHIILSRRQWLSNRYFTEQYTTFCLCIAALFCACRVSCCICIWVMQYISQFIYNWL